MKRKIIISIFSLPLLSLVFIFMPTNIANAGCCVLNNSCTNATSASECSTAAIYYTDSCTSSSLATICPAATAAPSTTPTTTPTATGTTTPTATGTTTPTTTPTTTGTATTTFANPIGFTTVADLLNAVLSHLMGIVAIVAVIFIIIGGVMYMMSGGNETMITRAKKTWTGAVIGFAIALASPTFLKEIQDILGGSGTSGNAQQWVSNALTIKQIAVNVLNLLLSIIGIIAIIALVIGGGMYLTAYGDEKKIDTGKRIITYAIIGIVISLASLVIVRQVAHLLGVA